MSELNNNYVVFSGYSTWTPEPGCVHSTDRAGGQPSSKCWNYHDEFGLLGKNQPTWHLFQYFTIIALQPQASCRGLTGYASQQGFDRVLSTSGSIRSQARPFIKTSERTSLLDSICAAHTHSFTYTLLPLLASSDMVNFPTPVGGNITDDDIGRKDSSSPMIWIGISHALQYLAPFFLHFTFSFFPQSLGIISNVNNGMRQPLSARYSRWNGESYLCRPSIKLTRTRVLLYSLRLRHAAGGSSRPGISAYQQASLGEPPSLQCLNPR